MNLKKIFKKKQIDETKAQTLEGLAENLFKDMDLSSIDPDFVEQQWKSHDIKRISAKVDIKDGVPYFDAPYGHHHGRYPDVKYLFLQTCRKYDLPDCSLIVFLNDAYASKFPAFSSIRRLPEDSYNIPIPMGNIRGMGDGNNTPLMGWDEFSKTELLDTHRHFKWEDKQKKAVFRGQYCHQTWKLGSYTTEEATTWKEVNRGVLHEIGSQRSDIFDIGFHKIGQNKFEEEIPTVDPIDFVDQQNYKYMVCMGTNANWAERLRNHLFTNSVLIKHEAECMEWFYYLIKPWEHYIPVDITLSNLIENTEWAINNDGVCKGIVKNANQFAQEYLNEETMFLFTKILIEKYKQKQ